MSESSPRSARTKKKSHLAKLAARKKESEDSASDMGSRSSLNDLRRKVLSRDVNNSNYYGSEDSDEGVGICGRSNGQRSDQYISNDGTLDRFQSMKVGASAMDFSDDESECAEEVKGNKRDRDQNSDGDDLRKDSGSFRVKKKSISNDSDEGPGSSQNHGLLPSDEMTDSDSSENDKLTQTYKRDDDREQMQEHYKQLLSAPEASDSPKVRRRSPLSMRKSELDPVEEHVTSDELSADPMRKFDPPRPSAVSPTPHRQRSVPQETPTTSTSGYPTLNRPWSAAMTEDSERSLQSTSALPLITTKEARNRSFLVGSMASSGSLLGTDELERFFPDRKMRVFIGTWNMCEMKKTPSSLDHFMLPDTCEYVCDMYVIGTQESTSNRKEWEIKLQETLGPQHVLYNSAAFGVLYLSVFIRRDLIWFCSVPEMASVSTRKFSAVKTKGGLGVCFTIFGTSILLVNCHLSPHDGKMKERIADYNKINAGLNLPKECSDNTYSGSSDDVSSKFDVVFWCGDTNFRLLKPRGCVENAMQGINAATSAAASALTPADTPADYEDLVQHDELFTARTHGEAFQDFQEGRIKFLPSYKYDVGTNNIDTSSKMRIPSYTDRVLFRCKRKHAVTCVHYDMAMDVMESDHKPVYGVYEVTLRPGRDNVNLSACQFNREVWKEGNRRRALTREAGGKSKGGNPNSSVCSVM